MSEPIKELAVTPISAAAGAKRRMVDPHADPFVGRTAGPFGQNLHCVACRAVITAARNVSFPATVGPVCCGECGAQCEFDWTEQGCVSRIVSGPPQKWTKRSSVAARR